MASRILNEIRKIRGEENLDIVKSNSDRYRVVVRDRDAISVYGFSMPIYRSDDRRLVDFRFRQDGNVYIARGSSSLITVDGLGVTLKKKNIFRVHFSEEQNFQFSEDVLRSEKIHISPTTNGIMVSAHAEAGERILIRFETSLNNPKIRKNNKYFSFLESRFRPYASISAMYQKSDSEGEYYPVKLNSEKNEDGSYNLWLTANPLTAGDICFEINVYENKLFQDTTVESKSPKENNAFGSIAFLGNTEQYGEQRLYSKLDFSRLEDLKKHRIKSVKLFYPVLGEPPVISVYQLDRRFCSFGSTWNKKVMYGKPVKDTGAEHGYITVDVTDLVCDENHRLFFSFGLLLRVSSEDSCCIMATGDSYLTPQIIEIKYEN